MLCTREEPFKRTGMGGYEKTYYITPNGDIVQPERTIRSRTGRHGSDVYKLEPSKTYYRLELYTSNSWKTTVLLKEVTLNADCTETGRSWTLRDDYSPEAEVPLSEVDVPQAVKEAVRQILEEERV